MNINVTVTIPDEEIASFIEKITQAMTNTPISSHIDLTTDVVNSNNESSETSNNKQDIWAEERKWVDEVLMPTVRKLNIYRRVEPSTKNNKEVLVDLYNYLLRVWGCNITTWQYELKKKYELDKVPSAAIALATDENASRVAINYLKELISGWENAHEDEDFELEDNDILPKNFSCYSKMKREYHPQFMEIIQPIYDYQCKATPQCTNEQNCTYASKTAYALLKSAGVDLKEATTTFRKKYGLKPTKKIYKYVPIMNDEKLKGKLIEVVNKKYRK